MLHPRAGLTPCKLSGTGQRGDVCISCPACSHPAEESAPACNRSPYPAATPDNRKKLPWQPQSPMQAMYSPCQPSAPVRHLRPPAICACPPSALPAAGAINAAPHHPKVLFLPCRDKFFSVSPLSSNFSALNIYYGSSDWPAPHKTASGHTQSLEPCHFFVHIALKFTLHIPILACKQRVYPARSSLALNGFPVCLICLSGSLLWKTLHVFGGLY